MFCLNKAEAAATESPAPTSVDQLWYSNTLAARFQKAGGAVAPLPPGGGSPPPKQEQASSMKVIEYHKFLTWQQNRSAGDDAKTT